MASLRGHTTAVLTLGRGREGSTALLESRTYTAHGILETATYPGDMRLQDNAFDATTLLRVVQRVESVMRTFRPTVVLTHSPADLNIDHRRTFEAVMSATRPVPTTGGWAKNIRTVMSFEVPSATEWGFGQLGDFRPNVFVRLEERDLSLAIEAMRVYDSEMRPAPHPRSEEVLRARAVRWGSYAGVGLAEAFQLVRAVV